MKKVITLCLFGLLVLAFSATAYAQAPKMEFKASGFIDMNTFWYRNVETSETANGVYGPRDTAINSPTGGGFDKDSNNWTNERMRLKFDFVTGKELSGSLFLEADSDRWGDVSGDRNKVGYWTGDRASLEVKNLYFDVGLPYFGIPVPMTARIGLQGMNLRPDIVGQIDGAGITLSGRFDPVTLTAQWFKAAEGKDAAADDSTAYTLKGDLRLGTMSVGAYGMYFNMNSYGISNQSATYGTNASYQGDVWWAGAYAQGKLGPLDIRAEGVYDKGKVEGYGTQTTAHDVKYEGYMGLVKATYPWERFAISGTLMYASGSDANRTSGTGLPGSTTALGIGTARSTKVGSYVVPPGDDSDFNGWDGVGIVMGSTVLNNAPHYSTSSGSVLTRGAAGGIWYGRLAVSTMLVPWYKITLAGAYYGDTTKNGNTLGSARRSATQLRDDDSIGWEFGLMNEIAVYKNLAWNIQLAYLFADDAFDEYNTATASNKSPKDPWLIGTRVIYSF